MRQVRTARDRLDRIVSIGWRSGRFWPAASVVVLVGTVASIIFTFTRQRVYKSETLMLYREGFRSAEAGVEPADPARKLTLKLKEMVLSRTRLQQIIDEHKLYPEIVSDRGYVDAVDEMRSHISFRVKDGDTFGLSFEGDDPARVQAITARLAVALIEENSKHRAAEAEATKEFLDAEHKHAEDELRDKEAALSKFLAKHPEFVRETQRAAQPKPHSGADPTLLALEREAGRIQERLGMPVQKRPREVPADPKLTATRNAAEGELAQAQRELAEKLSQFTDQHPDVKAARAQVTAAEAKLKRAQDMLADSAASQQKSGEADEGIIDRATLESQLKKVNDEIAAYKSKKTRDSEEKPAAATWIVALENDWSQLSRDVQEARARVSQLNEKQFKLSMLDTSVGNIAHLEVVDPAYRPTHPTRPSRSFLLLVGMLLSLVLGLVAAVTLALLDDRLYDRVDVERLELMPLLAVVPRAPKEVRSV